MFATDLICEPLVNASGRPDDVPEVTTTWRRPRGDVRAVALLLHGGQEHSLEPVRATQPSVLRILPLAWALRRRGFRHGLAVGRVRYRVRGWNGDGASARADTARALAEARELFGDVPIALIGYSMGGRVAVACAGADGIRLVVALAPWLPPTDSADGLVGRDVLFAHGSADHTTDPRATRAFARRAATVAAWCRMVVVRGDGHPMLRRPRLWHRLATDAVLRRLRLVDPPAAPDPLESAGSPVVL